MRPLKLDRREAIASLRGHIGYVYLMEDCDAIMNGLMAEMVGAERDQKLLALGRVFQAFYRVVSILRTSPEAAQEELDKELAEKVELEGQGHESTGGLLPYQKAFLDQVEEAAKAQVVKVKGKVK